MKLESGRGQHIHSTEPSLRSALYEQFPMIARPRLIGRSLVAKRGGVRGTGRFPAHSGRRGHAGGTWFPHRVRELKASVAHG